MKKIVILLDRDGTLIHEPPDNYQVDSFEKLSFLPGVLYQLSRLSQSLDVEWAMITNQDGLGTDAFPEETFWPVHNKMMEIMEGEGVHFKEVFIDKTFKAEGKPTRKPGTALLGKYKDGSYDLANSWVVGDRPSDIQLAKNLGAKGILLGRSVDDLDDEWDLNALREDTLMLETDDWQEITEFLIQYYARRSAKVHRKTKETDISVSLNLDGTGKTDCQTGIGFFDHMLDQLGKHSGMDLQVSVNGDLNIDDHHTIEDTALALGEAMLKALGDKRGIHRYGCFNLPMDEALARVAIDFSGRPWLVWSADFKREKVGELSTEMVFHFFKSLADTAKCNLNIQVEGENAHHMIEATFKGVAKSIKAAIAKTGDNSLPTTKGVL